MIKMVKLFPTSNSHSELCTCHKLQLPKEIKRIKSTFLSNKTLQRLWKRRTNCCSKFMLTSSHKTLRIARNLNWLARYIPIPKLSIVYGRTIIFIFLICQLKRILKCNLRGRPTFLNLRQISSRLIGIKSQIRIMWLWIPGSQMSNLNSLEVFLNSPIFLPIDYMVNRSLSVHLVLTEDMVQKIFLNWISNIMIKFR